MIYLDNAATSYPKPKSVKKAVNYCLKNSFVNANRSLYNSDFGVLEMVNETRELIAKMLNFKVVENVIFTPNATTSLNVLLKGFLKVGDHVIISSFSHNAVVRAVNSIDGVEVSIFDEKESRLADIIKENTKLVVLVHASNVTGELFDISEHQRVCGTNGIRTVLDASQSLGASNVDMEKLGVDAIAFTGHKCLLGIQGVGGFAITEDFAKEVEPLICGGTGEKSIETKQPTEMPSKYEVGTMNLPAIYSLNAGLKFIMKKGLANIIKHKRDLRETFVNCLKNREDIKIVEYDRKNENVGVVAADFTFRDNNEIANILYEKYKIKTRSGLQCAPLAHKVLNTLKTNTVRFRFGIINTKKEVIKTVKVINEILGSGNEN